MKELLHLFRLVTVSESTPYCVLCLRTETRRKLIESISLKRILACLKDEEVWPWKHAQDKHMQVCYICEARLVSAMRVVELVRCGVMVDQLLQCYRRKQLLRVSGQKTEHPLRHAMSTCNARFKAATSPSNLFLTEALAINITSETAAAEPTDLKTSAPKLQVKPKTKPVSRLKTRLEKNIDTPTTIGLIPLSNNNNTQSNSTGKIRPELPVSRVTAGPTPAINSPPPPTQDNPTTITLTETLNITTTGKFLALKTPGESVILHAIYQGTDGLSYVPTLQVMIEGGQLLPMPEFGLKNLPATTSNLPNMGIQLPGLEHILGGTGLETGANVPIQGNAGTNVPIHSNFGTNLPIHSNFGTNLPIQGNGGTNVILQGNAGTNLPIQSKVGIKAAGSQQKYQPKRTVSLNELHKIAFNNSGQNTMEPKLKKDNLKKPRTYKKKEKIITISPPRGPSYFDATPSNDVANFDAEIQSHCSPSNDVTNFDADIQLHSFKTEVELPNEKLIDVLEETALSMEDDPLDQVDQVTVPGPVAIKTDPDADDTREFTENADATSLQSDLNDIKLYSNYTQSNNKLTNTEKALLRLDIMNNYKQPIVPLIPIWQITDKNKQTNTKTNKTPLKRMQLTHPLMQIKKLNNTIQRNVCNKGFVSKPTLCIGPQFSKASLNTEQIKCNTNKVENKKIVYSVYDDRSALLHGAIPLDVGEGNSDPMAVLVSDSSDTEDDSKPVALLAQNVVKAPILKDGYSMDWEDKIPMDVITYMDATDPSVVPKRDQSFQQPNTDGGGALGVIVDAYSERDIVCIDLDE